MFFQTGCDSATGNGGCGLNLLSGRLFYSVALEPTVPGTWRRSGRRCLTMPDPCDSAANLADPINDFGTSVVISFAALGTLTPTSTQSESGQFGQITQTVSQPTTIHAARRGAYASPRVIELQAKCLLTRADLTTRKPISTVRFAACLEA